MPALVEGKHTAEHIIEEIGIGYARETVIMVSGSGKVIAGTPLGKLTANGKYKPVTATGSDGGQIAVAVSIYDCDATSADALIVVSARATVLNGKMLTYPATINDAPKRAAVIAQLATVNILVR